MLISLLPHFWSQGRLLIHKPEDWQVEDEMHFQSVEGEFVSLVESFSGICYKEDKIVCDYYVTK